MLGFVSTKQSCLVFLHRVPVRWFLTGMERNGDSVFCEFSHDLFNPAFLGVLARVVIIPEAAVHIAPKIYRLPNIENI